VAGKARSFQEKTPNSSRKAEFPLATFAERSLTENGSKGIDTAKMKAYTIRTREKGEETPK